jgi:hypothetical protein
MFCGDSEFFENTCIGWVYNKLNDLSGDILHSSLLHMECHALAFLLPLLSLQMGYSKPKNVLGPLLWDPASLVNNNRSMILVFMCVRSSQGNLLLLHAPFLRTATMSPRHDTITMDIFIMGLAY